VSILRVYLRRDRCGIGRTHSHKSQTGRYSGYGYFSFSHVYVINFGLRDTMADCCGLGRVNRLSGKLLGMKVSISSGSLMAFCVLYSDLIA